jgi:hypothetical protein
VGLRPLRHAGGGRCSLAGSAFGRSRTGWKVASKSAYTWGRAWVAGGQPRLVSKGPRQARQPLSVCSVDRTRPAIKTTPYWQHVGRPKRFAVDTTLFGSRSRSGQRGPLHEDRGIG